MKDTVSKWIESFKNYLNPREESHSQYVDDELYRGRRTVKRRNKQIMIRRYTVLGTGILVLCLAIGGIIWGFGKFSYSNKANHIQTRIEQLYTNKQRSDLKSSVTQALLDTLKTDIGHLKHRAKTDQLQKEQDLSQNAYTVQTGYDQLFNAQTRIGEKVTIKQVDHQLKSLKTKSVPTAFKTNYTQKLNAVRKVVVKTTKLNKRYQAIMTAHKNGQSIRVSTIDNLLQDMKKNQKSQKTVNQQTKLISLKSVVNKENKQAEKDAQAAAAAAEQAAAQQAAKAAAEAAASSQSAAESESIAEAAASSSAAMEQSSTSTATDGTTGIDNTSSTYTTDNTTNNNNYSAYNYNTASTYSASISSTN
jgi:septal ring factor EnvC (AmiA/AmiB activator)